MPELNKIALQFCAHLALYLVLGHIFLQNIKLFLLRTQGLVAQDCRATKIEKNSENGCCCCCNNIIILTKGVGHIALVILFKYNMFQFKSEFGSWIAVDGKFAR